MTTGYVPGLGDALRHGPWVAGLCAFGVTPGALIVIARLLERRWLLPREQFAAVAYGDPLLAVALGVGVWLTGARVPHGLTGPAAGVAAMVLTLAFGLAQWRDELRRGYYTRAQAVAPTKIWHQVVVYPVMGYWLWTACVTGLSAPGGAAVWTGKALLVALVGTWAATNVYDRRHPKLGHPPFDWRRGRPHERPWTAGSKTLEAAGGPLRPDRVPVVPSFCESCGSAKFCIGSRSCGWQAAAAAQQCMRTCGARTRRAVPARRGGGPGRFARSRLSRSRLPRAPIAYAASVSGITSLRVSLQRPQSRSRRRGDGVAVQYNQVRGGVMSGGDGEHHAQREHVTRAEDQVAGRPLAVEQDVRAGEVGVRLLPANRVLGP